MYLSNDKNRVYVHFFCSSLIFQDNRDAACSKDYSKKTHHKNEFQIVVGSFGCENDGCQDFHKYFDG